MNIFNLLVILYLFPIILIYLILCFILPLIKIGRIEKANGIIAHIIKDAIHADFLFEADYWRDIFPAKNKYIKIGWGDRKIFLETKSWKDLKIIDLIFAILGFNKTCLRVEFLDHVPENSTKLEMNYDQLKILKNYINQSYKNKLINKKSTYYQNGDYYESDLKYSPINNCNNWINKGLLKAKLTNRIWCPITFWF